MAIETQNMNTGRSLLPQCNALEQAPPMTWTPTEVFLFVMLGYLAGLVVGASVARGIYRQS